MTRGYRFLAVAAALATFPIITACGGGTAGGLPATTPAKGTASRSTVTFSIAVPKQSTSSKTRPAYVSPATQSMTIDVLQSGTSVVSQTVGLTASSAGCTSSLASVTCTLQLTLNAGSYTASITTYDGASGTGNALSTAQNVGFTVTAGQNNLIPLALSGIPASVAVSAASPTSVDVVAQDADGNYIVGPGAPAYTAAKTSGATVVNITQPTNSQPNLISFAVPAPAPSPGTETIGVTATFPSGETNGCAQASSCTASTSITASYEGTLWVPNHGGTDIFGFSLPMSSSELPAYTLNLSTEPEAIAVDAAGDLFSDTENATNGTFQEFAAPNFGVAASNAAGGITNYTMVVAPNGDASVAGANAVLLFTPPYTGTPVTLQNGTANANAVDSNSTFYAGYSNNTITSYPAPYTSPGATVTASGTINNMLVSANTLFVTENSSIDIYTLPLTAGSIPTTISIPTSAGEYFYGIAVDSSGDLWVSAFDGGANGKGGLLEYKPTFTSTESPSVAMSAPFGSDTSFNPYGLAIDGNNNVYVSTYDGGSASGAILEFSAPVSSGSTPAAVIDNATVSKPTNITLGAPRLVVTL